MYTFKGQIPGKSTIISILAGMFRMLLPSTIWYFLVYWSQPNLSMITCNTLVVTLFWVPINIRRKYQKEKKEREDCTKQCRFERHCASSPPLHMQRQGKKKFISFTTHPRNHSPWLVPLLTPPISTCTVTTPKEERIMPCSGRGRRCRAASRHPALHHDRTRHRHSRSRWL